MSPPPQLCFPFTNRVKQLTHHPNPSSASSATLTSITSAATKLQFTEDTESYYNMANTNATSPQPSRSNSTGTAGTDKTIRTPNLQRMFTWRKHDSTATLVSDEQQYMAKKGVMEHEETIEIIDTTPRLQALRKKMHEEGEIDYFIIPSEDGHLSEYVAPSDKRLQWISAFTGSAGCAIVSKRSAYLFVDSRYWIQAEREHDRNWTILKTGTAELKDWLDWAITCPRGSKIAIDSRMISHERATKLYKGLYDRGSKLLHPRQNLVDLVWEERPKRPRDQIYVQPEEYTGRGIREKLSDVRRWIRKQNGAIGKQGPITRQASTNSKPGAANAKVGANGKATTPTGAPGVKRSMTTPSGPRAAAAAAALNKSTPMPTPITPTPPSAIPARLASPAVKRSNSSSPSTPLGPSGQEKLSAVFVADLASIAWVLNLRGSDVPFNPVFAAYLMIGIDGKTTLFIESAKVTDEVKEYLREGGVSLKEYSEVWTYIRQKQWGEGKVIISPNTPYAVSLIIGSHRYAVLPAYIEEAKAVKNPVELDGMRNAYIRDGIAMIRWLAWLDQKFSSGYEISEWEASDRLNMFRENELKDESEPASYMGPAYENIIAYGANAALPHYTPSKNDSRQMGKNECILVDSGGQYRDGTCDTSRTVHFGYPTVEQAEAFTRVLQGHIAIDTACFPAGTSGATLDVLARKALWKDKLNYGHGTGHGVGSFLSVHEGPHSFSSTTPLQTGHVITNEPGFYKDGEFGVRIESALVVRELAHDKEDEETGKKQQWFGFERLTMVPIQMKMVRASLLSKDERMWIKEHNNHVRKTLEPLLEGDKRALKWLRKECQKTFGNEGKGSAGLSIEWD